MSSKRSRENDQQESKLNKKSSGKTEQQQPSKKDEAENSDDMDEEFEDEYEDEFEPEEVVVDNDDDNEEGDGEGKGSMEVDEDDETNAKLKAFLPGIDQLAEGEVLEADAGAYVMLHSMELEWSALSFDVLPDKLGVERTKFPMSCYFVSATQADRKDNNKIILTKASMLTKTQHDDEDEFEGDDSDDVDDDPEVEFRSIKHPGAVNRLKVMPQEPGVVATWCEDGKIYLWELSAHIKSLDVPPPNKLSQAYTQKLDNHTTEGFAMNWSTVEKGRLITGDCNSGLYLTLLHDGLFVQDPQPFKGHSQSVEDLAFSPTERDVFASCSADKTVKIWDCRMKKQPARSIQAANCDVNVLSWNHKVPYLMVSGADDGSFSIWDLRSLKQTANGKVEPVAHFTWHTKKITSIEWDPNDESVLAAAGADDQLTVWDLSVERDEGEEIEQEGEFPPQLLFIHQGQKNIKELHWHPQLPGVLLSTAEDSFNIFKPDIVVEKDPTK